VVGTLTRKYRIVGDSLSNNILSGIMGLVVGDALGVPVEFQDRETLRLNPVNDMMGYGTYNQAPGTWSDDSSMTLALLDSLKNGLDYEDIMDKFLAWYEEGAYTPHGQMFDIGIATSQALRRYREGYNALEAGGQDEYDNGNGSLMRILPILFYLQKEYGPDFLDYEKSFEIIHNVSGLTHRHKRSQIGCGIYIAIGHYLSLGKSLEVGISKGIEKAFNFYRSKTDFKEELGSYSRLENPAFKDLAEDEIRSGGYVVDSLEASLWCLLNSQSYEETVLKAVNLGKDTDTTGAICGGLAGLFYGYDAIPEAWLSKIVKRDWIEDLCKE
jgi:ADP-ribosyl-[dinitrogen reductase] hydrolase